MPPGGILGALVSASDPSAFGTRTWPWLRFDLGPSKALYIFTPLTSILSSPCCRDPRRHRRSAGNSTTPTLLPNVGPLANSTASRIERSGFSSTTGHDSCTTRTRRLLTRSRVRPHSGPIHARYYHALLLPHLQLILALASACFLPIDTARQYQLNLKRE